MEAGGKQYPMKKHLKISEEKKASRAMNALSDKLVAYLSEDGGDEKELERLWGEIKSVVFEKPDEVPAFEDIGSTRFYEVMRDFFGRALTPTK